MWFRVGLMLGFIPVALLSYMIVKMLGDSGLASCDLNKYLQEDKSDGPESRFKGC